jgi:long-chain acyl-CoA synthetase
VETINQMWLNAVAENGQGVVVANRESKKIKSSNGRIDEELVFNPVTYEELNRMVLAFGAGLGHLGLQEKEGVALIAENSMRWLVSDLAVLANRAFDVPRGCSSTIKELTYILGHSKVRFAILSDEEQLDRVLKIQESLRELKVLIVLDPEFKNQQTGNNKEIYSFDEVITLGEEFLQSEKGSNGTPLDKRREETTASDLATLMYTSGTSGTPKGTPLTHGNIMHNVNVLPEMLKMEKEKLLSILPIWHSFERIVEYAALRSGSAIYYSTPPTVIKDMAVVNPNLLAGVPRLWMGIYNNIMLNIRYSGKEDFFRKLYAHCLRVMEARRYRHNRQYLVGEEKPRPARAGLRDYFYFLLGELLIYRKIRKKLGKSFTTGISGGGSLPSYVDDFFEVIGITLLEGYGLTETSPVLTLRTMDHRIPYTCGSPLQQTEIQIRNEDGEVLPDGQKGIVWARGPQVMSGYYRNPEETAKALERDKQHRTWFNTGDLGLITKQGDLTIIGRAKDTIVLNNGENIEPGPIEKMMVSSPYIEQAMVCGQDQEFLTALVVPEKKLLNNYCDSIGIDFREEEVVSLARNGKIKEFYGDTIKKAISSGGEIKEIETIVNFTFTLPFTVADDTLTHTLKIKRNKILERDERLIRGMYPHYTEKGAAKGTAKRSDKKPS